MKQSIVCLFAAAAFAGCASTETAPDESLAGVTVEFLSPEHTDEPSIDLSVEIPETGRYRVEIELGCADGVVWLEDYVGNPDDRTYDITGPIVTDSVPSGTVLTRDGSPLQAGVHSMRLHLPDGGATVQSVKFTLLRPHVVTPRKLTQRTVGTDWEIVWADEFNGAGLPDAAKWTHDLGNWGWGNRELQYYTENDVENARQENGHLVIEAHPDDDGFPWTSARLTTRGKVAFLYGKFEFRARVTAMDGVWVAGWMLGDAYRDEISWPYCGEIDVMEAVGKEIDDVTGDGINHGACHTRAYYFKQGNHIANTIPVADMSDEFHVYGCEWDEDEVRMYVDGEHFYTYAQHDSPEAWPFDDPQCLVINLAMGGGMGGDVAANATAQRVEVDWIRVYERR